jgi:hypothetical protein
MNYLVRVIQIIHASLTSKALITSAHIGGHDANSTNTTISSTLEFALSFLAAASDEQYDCILAMRSPCWRERSMPCTSFAKTVGDHLGASSSVATPPTSLPTAPRGRSSTPPISTTTSSGMTTTRATTRSTASRTRRRRSSRSSCPEHVLP